MSFLVELGLRVLYNKLFKFFLVIYLTIRENSVVTYREYFRRKTEIFTLLVRR